MSTTTIPVGLQSTFKEGVPLPLDRYKLWKWVVVILAVSVLVDLFYFTGFYSSDDISYYEFARYWWANGKYPSVDRNLIGGLRLPIVVWNRLVISLFGPHPQAVAATYVISHQILTCLTVALAARLFDFRTALLTAYVSAMAPPLIQLSTTMLPDIPMACCVVLSLYALMRAYDRTGVTKEKPSFAWMVICGIAVGGAYLIKESGLILLPFYFVLWLVFSRSRGLFVSLKFGIAFLLGVVLMFALETAVFSAVFGKLFFRLAWTVDDLDPAVRNHIAAYGLDPMTRFGWAQRRMNEYYSYLPTFVKWFLVAVLAAYPFFKKARWPVFAMLLWQFGFLTWGTMRWSEYFPPSIQSRYYIAALPFAIIMVSFVACRLFVLVDRVQIAILRRVVFGLVVCGFVLAPLTGIHVADEKAGKAYRASTIGNAAAALRFALDQNDGPIVLSSYLRHRMKYIYQDLNYKWILNANVIEEPHIIEMLQKGHFYYVETARQPFAPRTPIDKLLNGLVVESLTLPELVPAPTSVPFDDPIVASNASKSALDAPESGSLICWSASRGSIGSFSLGGIEAMVQEVGWFRPSKTRTADVALTFGHSIIPETLVEKRTNLHSVRLLRIVPIGSNALVSSGELPDVAPRVGTADPADALAKVVTYDLSHSLKGWGLSRKNPSTKPLSKDSKIEPATRMVGRPDAGPLVMLDLEGTQYEWLTHAAEFDARDLPLKPNRRYEFIVDSEFDAPVIAEIRFDVFADSELRQPVLQKKIGLRAGQARFAVRTGPATAYFRASFRLSGKGTFSLQRFLISSQPNG